VPLPSPLLLMQVRAMRHPLEWIWWMGQGSVGWCHPVCRWGCPWRLVAGRRWVGRMKEMKQGVVKGGVGGRTCTLWWWWSVTIEQCNV